MARMSKQDLPVPGTAPARQRTRESDGAPEAADSTTYQDYDITVFTGDVDGAGTDGNVWIWMDGLLGGRLVRSGWQELDNDAHDDFERGAADHFSLRLPSLGTIEAVYVYFEPSGLRSDWYFDRVIINGAPYFWDDWVTTAGYVQPEPLGTIVQT
ncbi:PLAT/LH2 domain-containing protein [Geodermatophilus sp. SYSU D01062]